MANKMPDDPEQSGARDAQASVTADERALNEALLEFIDRSATEEPLDVVAFCNSYPQFRAELRSLLDEFVALDSDSGETVGSSDFDQSSVENDPLPGTLSGHKILGDIGTGGMGRVLLAYDDRLRRKVAIKTLRPKFSQNRSLRTRFMQEARALAQLHHPNIVSIYYLGKADEPPHFVMEFVEGVTMLEAARALTLEQKAELMQKVALAVEFLHRHSLLHRDLKPANVLVGADLEPKLLDFGLASHVDGHDGRITEVGDVIGTPDYFSPEQTRPGAKLDARSDVFSLGTVFYELLTGTLPFRGESRAERTHNLREADPVLPRRLIPELPGDLQNICLKALEKNPSDRYASAKEMADDLERFLARETVLAAPTSYTHLMSGKIEQHLRELESWRQDEIISDYEWDSLRKNYGRLIEREDAWILEARRLAVPQVSLYLGAWVLIVGATLLFLFRFVHLSGAVSVLMVTVACAFTVRQGMLLWSQGQLRIAMAYLLAFSLLLPVVLLVAMGEFHLWASPAQDKNWELLWDLPEPFRRTTNAQLWWSIFTALPAYLWLRRLTRSSVFSLVFAVMALILCHVTMLRFGLLSHIPNDPSWYYFRLIPIALFFFATALLVERLGFPNDSRYYYPIAVVATLAALSGLAVYHTPYQDWLEHTFPWTRGQIEYLFIANAGIYFVLQRTFERFPSAQMRTVAKYFRFFVPGHVLTSVLSLGLTASDLWHKNSQNVDFKHEARTFEILLPVLACGFVYGSIPKQMKNYVVSGMVFLAIGILRLQDDIFQQEARWPVSLLILGILLMVFSAKYSTLKTYITRKIRRLN